MMDCQDTRPNAADVLRELAAAREQACPSVLDALRLRQPAWPWHDLLPLHAGVTLLASLVQPNRMPVRRGGS